MTPGVDFANSSVQYDNYTTDAGSCTTYVGNKTTEAANETGGGTEQLQGTINLKKRTQLVKIDNSANFEPISTNYIVCYVLTFIFLKI